MNFLNFKICRKNKNDGSDAAGSKKNKVLIIFALIFTFGLGVAAIAGFMIFEPEISEAATTSDDVVVTVNVTSEISISHPTDFSLSPDIPGMTGGAAVGTSTWTIITNDTSGFNLKLKASTDPALQSGANSFADFTSASTTAPQLDWSIDTTASEFGFTVEPATAADTMKKFLDDGVNCNQAGGSNNPYTCWYKFSTSDITVVNRTSVTTISGQAEAIGLRAEVGATRHQPDGAYTATLTATATTN